MERLDPGSLPKAGRSQEPTLDGLLATQGQVQEKVCLEENEGEPARLSRR